MGPTWTLEQIFYQESKWNHFRGYDNRLKHQLVGLQQHILTIEGLLSDLYSLSRLRPAIDYGKLEEMSREKSKSTLLHLGGKI